MFEQFFCRAIQTKTPQALVEFPRNLIPREYLGIYDWVMEYSHKYKELPQLERIRKNFPHFFFVETSLPTWDLFDQALSSQLKAKLKEAYEELDESSDVTPEVILDKFGKIMFSSVTRLQRFTTFDRSEYLRKTGRYSLGFKVLDSALGGLRGGDFFVVAGRLGTGKSTLAQYWAFKWSQEGNRVLYISKEMLPTDVFARIDAFKAGFNPLVLRKSGEETERVVNNILDLYEEDICAGDIYIPSRQISTPDEIGVLAANLNVDIIIIDGLYLLSPSGKPRAKWEMVSDVSNRVKQIGLDLKVPIIALTQIKRGAGEEYTTEDLSYSDSIGQDADFVATIKPVEMDSKSFLELTLIKNRYGQNIGTLARVDFETMDIYDESIGGVSVVRPYRTRTKSQEDKDGEQRSDMSVSVS